MTDLRLAADTQGDRQFKFIIPFGSWAIICAVGSLTACYGSIVSTAFFGTEPLGLNPHVQAVVMWGLGVLAIYAMWRDRARHRRNIPLIVGATGLAILIFSLYVRYDNRFEILAYVLLLVGALLNQNAMLSTLYRTVRRQARHIQDLNDNLEGKVREQIGEIERLGRLKDFLAPQIAELVVAQGKETLLDSHRRYIACLFCDIRDFTGLSDSVEPEEVMGLLQTYHARVGRLAAERNGTIGFRAGDGLMVFFNDPIPCEEPVLDAVRLALDIREAVQDLRERWVRLGYPIGFGMGIAAGYATLGLVGDFGRTDYTAIGNVVNIAARLSDAAQDGEVLLDQRAYLDTARHVRAEPRGEHQFKGVGQSMEIFNVLELLSPSDPL